MVLFLNFGVPSLNSVIHLPAAICTCSHFCILFVVHKNTLSSNNGLICFVMDCKWMKILSICDIKIFRYIYIWLVWMVWIIRHDSPLKLTSFQFCVYLHSFICYHCAKSVPISVDLHLSLYQYYLLIYFILNMTTAFTFSNKTKRRRKIKGRLWVAMRNHVSMSQLHVETLWTYWYICTIFFSFFYPRTIVMHLHTSPKNPKPKPSWTYFQ